MKKIIISLLAIGVLGVAYWLISPLFIKTVSDEKITDLPGVSPGTISAEPAIVSRGEFTDGESGHHAKGEALLLKLADGGYAVRFEDGFEITNGPDLFVYLGKDGEYDKNANLGGLKGSVGGQNYLIPSEIDISKYNEVWIWCRAFSVKFGSARLAQIQLEE
ncbi:MAG TPA: DM13 domain-containing protein [Candidatus Paceibacterota bacterium]